jgi:hypothetical protein
MTYDQEMQPKPGSETETAAAEAVSPEGGVIEGPSLPTEGPADGEVSATVRTQLDRLTTQIHGLQAQLDAFIANRNEAVAERASQHVASIVAAAEQAAAEIRVGAERDAAAIRERLLTEVQAEVQRIRSDAELDAARVRTEAHAHAARVRETAITEASTEIQAVCAELAERLQATARGAIAGMARGAPVGEDRIPAPAAVSARADEPQPATSDVASPTAEGERLTNDVEDAVNDLQSAAAALEHSLRHLRAIGEEEQRAGPS